MAYANNSSGSGNSNPEQLLKPLKTAIAQYKRGYDCVNSKDHRGAAEAFGTVIDLITDPQWEENKQEIQRQTSSWDESFNVLENDLRGCRLFAGISYDHCANAKEEEGDLNGAIEEHYKAVRYEKEEMHKTSIPVLGYRFLERAKAHEAKGNAEQALWDYKCAAALTSIDRPEERADKGSKKKAGESDKPTDSEHKLAEINRQLTAVELVEIGNEGFNRKAYAAAFPLYCRAADMGHFWGQFNLGNCYSHGWGTPVDHIKAVEWFRKAAEQGYDKAQNNLGWAYQNGNGIPKNLETAREWYQKAAAQGHELAKQNLENIKDQGFSWSKAVIYTLGAALLGLWIFSWGGAIICGAATFFIYRWMTNAD